jgi:hypothetical protein
VTGVARLVALILAAAVAGSPLTVAARPQAGGANAKPDAKADSPTLGNQRIVAVLDVRVEGVPPEVAAQFQRQLESQLDTRRFWLAPRSRVMQMMAQSTRWTEGCLVGKCLSEVKSQTRAELVLLAALTGSGTSFGYVVTLVRTDTGRQLAQAAERCEVCTVNEALTNATAATVKLLTEVPDELPDEDASRTAELEAARQQVTERQAQTRRHYKRVSVAVTLTGVALAAAGTTLYLVRDGAEYGLVTAAVGGGMAAGGIFVLTF